MVDLSGPLVIVRGKSGSVDPAVINSAARGVALLEGNLREALGDTIPARVRMRYGAPELRLRIPRTAPPGHYQATVQLNEQSFPISIEVPVRNRLRINPAALQFSGVPGECANTSFVIQNRGNSLAELPQYAFAGAFANDGLATAFSSTYELDSDDPMELFGNFVLRLRDSYAGLIKMRVEGAKLPLLPGEQRELAASITIPSQESVRGNLRLGKGRKFHTIFHYGDLRIMGRIAITGSGD